MSKICTRCQGEGFINVDQIPEDTMLISDKDYFTWMNANTGHDVQVCDCCGDGENWYGEPGEHYNKDDPRGSQGPYEYNGGLCECD